MAIIIRILSVLWIICFSSGVTAQVEHTTRCNQDIVVFSDFTWERISSVEKGVPFELPKGFKNSDQFIQKYKRLLSHVASEEISDYVKTLQNPEDQLLSQRYKSTSFDLLTLMNFKFEESESIANFTSIYDKYFLTKLRDQVNSYAPPKINGLSKPHGISPTTYQEIFPFSNNTYICTAYDQLTTYTPDRLRNYYKDRDYIMIETRWCKSNKDTRLMVRIIFASKDIIKSYGTISKDGFIRATFLSGKTIFLSPEKAAKGEIEPYTGKTIYEFISVPLDVGQLSQLSRTFIDKIGVLWTSGFEDYNVYNVDHLITTFSTLNGTKQ